MRRLVAVCLAAVLVLGGTGMAVAGHEPDLAAHGPTSVSGTEATAVFRIGGRTVRQVRYEDEGTLVYSFVLANDGRLPVTITGLRAPVPAPRLFEYVAIADTQGRQEFTVPAGERVGVTVSLRMTSCETLSARAGSFANDVHLTTEVAGVMEHVVTVPFPEQVHTGSPREAFCPDATATSRPPG